MKAIKQAIAKIPLKRPHQWERIGSAGDIADSTVFKCRVCGIHATCNGTPDDKQYPSCKYVTERPKGPIPKPIPKPISSESPGIEPPFQATYKRRVGHTMKIEKTFTANIYVGLRRGYTGDVCSVHSVRVWLKNFCDSNKVGVTLTETEFLYVDGGEPGVIVGLIQYPRFPRPVEELKATALNIALGLMTLCQQERVSIVFSDETVMLEKEPS